MSTKTILEKLEDWDQHLLEEIILPGPRANLELANAAAMSLQRFGDKEKLRLLLEMEKWRHGNLLDSRAAIAGICEPRLLKNADDKLRVLKILDEITEGIVHEDQRKSDKFVALKKVLGYCWSVAVVSKPEDGKRMMGKWMLYDDADIQRIMKENLKKNRLQKLDLG